MTGKLITSRPWGRPPKPMPLIEASPERVARAVFSALKKRERQSGWQSCFGKPVESK